MGRSSRMQGLESLIESACSRPPFHGPTSPAEAARAWRWPDGPPSAARRIGAGNRNDSEALGDSFARRAGGEGVTTWWPPPTSPQKHEAVHPGGRPRKQLGLKRRLPAPKPADRRAGDRRETDRARLAIDPPPGPRVPAFFSIAPGPRPCGRCAGRARASLPMGDGPQGLCKQDSHLTRSIVRHQADGSSVWIQATQDIQAKCEMCKKFEWKWFSM